MATTQPIRISNLPIIAEHTINDAKRIIKSEKENGDWYVHDTNLGYNRTHYQGDYLLIEYEDGTTSKIREGYGILKFLNSDSSIEVRYEGEFKDHYYFHDGKFYERDSSDAYLEGIFKEKYIYSTTFYRPHIITKDIQFAYRDVSYEGEFYNNERHGKGTLYSGITLAETVNPDENIYGEKTFEDEFKNGKNTTIENFQVFYIVNLAIMKRHIMKVNNIMVRGKFTWVTYMVLIPYYCMTVNLKWYLR